jgi:hypothetical protein
MHIISEKTFDECSNPDKPSQILMGRTESAGLKRQSISSSRETIMQVFRQASEGYGTYCPIKNELRVRKGRKVYRFICAESELRFLAPGSEEVVLYFACDITILEFKRCIAYLLEMGAARKS